MDRTTDPLTHTHRHREMGQQRAALLFAAGLTGAMFLVELGGALYSRSLALLSDAGHVFMDLSALLFSLLAIALAARPESSEKSFGLHRAEVLAALVNGLLVLGMALGIIGASVHRLFHPVAPLLKPMILFGGLGLAVNLIVAAKLHAPSRGDINMRSAFLHVASDAGASVGVILGGIAIHTTGQTWVDPAVGIAIALVIVWNASRLLRESVHLLLEGVPRHVKLVDVADALGAVPGVTRVEDVHVWGLCSHLTSLSAHLRVKPDNLCDPRPLLQTIHRLLRERFAIHHATVELHTDDSSETQ